MERWDDFEDLARRARQEPPPRVEVTHRVLATIATRRGAAAAFSDDTRPMLLCAAGALLAASVVALVASHAWLELNDPFGDLVAGLAVLDP